MFGDLKKEIDHELELKEKAEEERKAKIEAGEVVEEEKKEKKAEKDEQTVEVELDTTRIFTRNDILNFLRKEATKRGRNPDERLFVGTVGYPNVGKSSLINVLCGRKRVGVAAMPGKTKHF